jgi:hypothetical protein
MKTTSTNSDTNPNPSSREIKEEDLFPFLGTFVVINGEDFLLAGFANGLAVFENEGERITFLSLLEAALLLLDDSKIRRG